jgi:N-acetylmuramoyl-L-alanine amidase
MKKRALNRWITLATTILLLTTGCAGQGAGQSAGQSVTASTKPAGPLAGVTVALDPGHGGRDSGSVGTTTGVTEAELNLAVALKLQVALEAQGAYVVLTRTDENVTYMEEGGDTQKRQEMAGRIAVIEEARAQMVISIHMNRYADASVRGAQVFFYDEAASGRPLAQAIQESLNDLEEQVKKRNALSGNYYILKTPLCPSALVECGFLSNPTEETLLQQQEYQQKLADAICRGVEEYWEQARTTPAPMT